MSKTVQKPVLKQVLELGPVVLFFIAYMLVKDDVFTIGGQEYSGFLVVTALFIHLVVIAAILSWYLLGHVSRAQIVTVVLVVLFGGLSLWLRDDRFFKMKPTAVYALFVVVLGFGLLRGRSYLEYAMDGALNMTHEGWMVLTKRLTLFFVFLALANEVIWRNFSTETWVYFKTFGLTIAMLGFFAAQFGLLKAHGAFDDPAADESGTKES